MTTASNSSPANKTVSHYALGIENLPSPFGELVPGKLYAIICAEPAMRIAILAHNLRVNANSACTSVLVSWVDPRDRLQQAKLVGVDLTASIDAGRVAALKLHHPNDGDTKISDAGRLEAALASLNLPQGSMVVFDEAERLFDSSDTATGLRMVQALSRWASQQRHAALLLFCASQLSRSRYERLKPALSLLDGHAKVLIHRQQLTFATQHWLGRGRAAANEPLRTFALEWIGSRLTRMQPRAVATPSSTVSQDPRHLPASDPNTLTHIQRLARAADRDLTETSPSSDRSEPHQSAHGDKLPGQGLADLGPHHEVHEAHAEIGRAPALPSKQPLDLQAPERVLASASTRPPVTAAFKPTSLRLIVGQAVKGFETSEDWQVVSTLTEAILTPSATMRGLVILPYEMGMPLRVLAETVFAIKRRAPAIHVLVRETDRRLRISAETALLRVGASMILHASMQPPELRSVLLALAQLPPKPLERLLPVDAALNAVRMPRSAGLLPPEIFAARTLELLENADGVDLPCSLVQLKPKATFDANVPTSYLLHYCRDNLICANDEAWWVFLHGCRDVDAPSVLQRSMQGALQSLFETPQVLKNRSAITAALAAW